MLSRLLLFLFTLSLTCLAQEKPNILIIFTDDQGYADLSVLAIPKIKLRVLISWLGRGTKFTSFYSQTVCGPSRSALLTGRYPFRSKGWGMPASEITFAEIMKNAGYQTACIGKWDVSSRKPIIDRMPNAQGFDYYFGPLEPMIMANAIFMKIMNQPEPLTIWPDLLVYTQTSLSTTSRISVIIINPLYSIWHIR